MSAATVGMAGTIRPPRAPGGVGVRSATTIDDLDGFADLWAPLRSGPASDLEQFRVDLRGAPPSTRPHAFLVEEDGTARAGLLGRLEDGELALKIGYRSLARVPVRVVVVEAEAIVGDLSEGRADLLLGALDRSLRNAGADLVLLRGLVVDSPAHRWATSIPSALRRDRRPQSSLRWTLRLPGSADELAGSRSAHRKAHLRYYWNRLQRRSSRIDVRKFTSPADLPRFFLDAERVAARAYQRGLGVGFRDDAATRERLGFQADRGRLRAWILYIEGEPCAYAMGVRDGETYYSGDMGHEPRHRSDRIGELLLERALEDLSAEGGIRLVDFGFGDETYKRRISDASREEANVRIFAATARGAVLGVASGIFSAVDAGLRHGLKRVGAFEAVRRWARRRLAERGAGRR